MLRFVACLLLAPLGLQDGPAVPTSGMTQEPAGEKPAAVHSVNFARPLQGFAEFQGATAFQAADGNLGWIAELTGQSNLALTKLDDATRGQLGVAEGRGLIVTSVRANGPAWEAGVREQDVLLTLGDQPLAEIDDLDRLLKKSGDQPATLTLLRKRKPLTLKVMARVQVELGPIEEKAPEYWIGASVEPIAAVLREQLDLPADQGLSVSRLVDGAPAAKCGLKVHDVLLTVDGATVPDAAGLLERVGKAGAKAMHLEVLRAGERRTLVVTPEKRPLHDVTNRSYTLFHQSPTTATYTNKYVDVFRPGVVVGDGGQTLQGLLAESMRSRTAPAPDADAATKRIDEIAAEIKALREAVESLRKALETKE
ncbi:PDZ domain-containing protein [Paludisphaera mucosa]|uniref:PDZ domain-containing protein n=1 Tax=Paludisphaera mucosa TaxID=3030827 RepID=A0ABT6FK27_9BACT|nr:PDZ domain-containing protein [Paludisphaera mucosa]MDG3007909.1 PDZ domain-containing protein [Paludisphaera mucosa]